MRLDRLLQSVPDARLLQGDPTLEIRHISADSRALRAGSLFVAVAGGSFDGHTVLAQVAGNGAIAAAGRYSLDELRGHGIDLPVDFPYIQVADSRRALAHFCAAFYDFPSRSMTVAGITGTDGKTTTSTLLESIFAHATHSDDSPAGRVGVITTVGARIRGVESDTGLHVTTPDAPEVQSFLAEMRDAGCAYAVVESTSHGLDQGRVAAVDFDIAAVTNITHEHLDYHGTREAYVQAKARLFRALYHSPLKPGIPRIAVLNADDAGSFDALRAALAEEAATSEVPVQVYRYGLSDETDVATNVTASGIVYGPQSTRFTLSWWGDAFEVETRLIGEFNVYNILCAATAALALGIAPETVAAGVAAMPGVIGRMERIDRGQNFLAIVDFAHSPVSLERALNTLRPLVGQTSPDGSGRLIAVFGCAGLRDRAKRRLMGQVAGRLADYTVVTAEDPRTEDLDEINRAIAAGILECASQDAFTIIPDRTQAIQAAIDMARPGDVVAAFGKGHERSMCFGVTEYPWSDQQAMIDALDRTLSHA